jgi:hypothetical protein
VVAIAIEQPAWGQARAIRDRTVELLGRRARISPVTLLRLDAETGFRPSSATEYISNTVAFNTPIWGMLDKPRDRPYRRLGITVVIRLRLYVGRTYSGDIKRIWCEPFNQTFPNPVRWKPASANPPTHRGWSLPRVCRGPI